MSNYQSRDSRWGTTVLFFLIIALVVTATIVVVTGCGTPHEKSAAEIRQEQAQAKQDQIQARRNEEAQARIKRAQLQAKIDAMPKTPPGIEQMDSTHFYVHHGFEGNTRDLCRSSSNESSAGIASIGAAPNGTNDIIVTCNNAEHEYRHNPFTTKATP